MKKIYYYLFFAILFAGCENEEWLNEVKPSSNTVPDEFTSNLDLDNLTRGAYFNMKTPGTWGMQDLWMFQDIQADILEQITFGGAALSGTYNLVPVYQRDPSVNDIDAIQDTWGGAYVMLNNAATVINFYEENEPFEDAYKHWAPVLTGESYFLRAYAHYMLAATFAPPYSSDPDAKSIILIKEPTKAPTDLHGLNSNQEVYELIIQDLKKAIELLPEDYDVSSYREDFQDRANKNAARFLLAKVYFLMGSEFWSTGLDGDGGALEQIDILINSNRYPLVNGNDLKKVFNARGNGKKESETVFYGSYYFRNAWRIPRNFMLYCKFDDRSRSFSFSKSAINEIGWGDEEEANKDKRYLNLFRRYENDGSGVNGSDPRYAGEYEDSYHIWSTKFTLNTANFVIFRSPELYLMRSAIKLNEGDNSAALNDLNVTRERAGLSPLESINAEEVEKEWIKEFAFEGRRLFYLQATQQDIPPGDRANTTAISYDDPSLVRRIPRSELTRNPNLGKQ